MCVQKINIDLHLYDELINIKKFISEKTFQLYDERLTY